MIVTKTTGNLISQWNAIKIKLKVSFPQLAETDLNFEEVQKNEMLRNIQSKLGKSTQELKFIIDTL